MSPDERAQDWRERLVAETRHELERIERVVADLGSELPLLVPDCRSGVRMGTAGYLHSFYTGWLREPETPHTTSGVRGQDQGYPIAAHPRV